MGASRPAAGNADGGSLRAGSDAILTRAGGCETAAGFLGHRAIPSKRAGCLPAAGLDGRANSLASTWRLDVPDGEWFRRAGSPLRAALFFNRGSGTKRPSHLPRGLLCAALPGGAISRKV